MATGGTNHEFMNAQFTLPNFTSMFAMLFIVMAAFLALPRQFQVMVVELKMQKDTWLSRRVFPLYLLGFCVVCDPFRLGWSHATWRQCSR